MTSNAQAHTHESVLHVRPPPPPPTFVQSLGAFERAIQALGAGRKWAEAVRLMSEVEEAGLVPDEDTYSGVIRDCCKVGVNDWRLSPGVAWHLGNLCFAALLGQKYKDRFCVVLV